MNILHVSSEAKPFAESGGLADVVEGLSRQQARMGHRVALVLPAYKPVMALRGISQLQTFEMQFSAQEHARVRVLHTRQESGVDAYFLQVGTYFDRDQLYGYKDSGVEYEDSHKRFAFFSRAVVEFIKRSPAPPDILHCHDWQAGLVPLLCQKEPSLKGRLKTVFTIHNIAYQGSYDAGLMPTLGLDWRDFHTAGMEHFGRLNFMKTGISCADFITTVSPTHCAELKTAQHGMGFESLLQRRQERFCGILNGIDNEYWNPAVAAPYPYAYDAGNISPKLSNKAALQARLGLEASNFPLFAFVGRIVQQKGLDILLPVLWELLDAGQAQVAFLGVGDASFISELQAMQIKFPGRLACEFNFNREASKWIYAGADAFLMPSLYEPCGISQLIALRYGAIPVVRSTGGLIDSVADAEDAEHGCGFRFERYSSAALYRACARAIGLYQDQIRWHALQKRAMGLNFSWSRAAAEYLTLYGQLLAQPAG